MYQVPLTLFVHSWKFGFFKFLNKLVFWSWFRTWSQLYNCKRLLETHSYLSIILGSNKFHYWNTCFGFEITTQSCEFKTWLCFIMVMKQFRNNISRHETMFIFHIEFGLEWELINIELFSFLTTYDWYSPYE